LSSARPRTGERHVEGFQAEVAGQRVGQPPRQDVATVEIHDGREVEQAMLERDVRDVAGPDLIGLRDRHIPQ
jgi:hypothetical protein